MRKKRNRRPSAVAAALLLALTVHAAEQAPSNSPPKDVLLLDPMGRLVKVPTNEVSAALQPSPEVGLTNQTPAPAKGASMPAEVVQRQREAAVESRLFPAAQPPLMPYLGSLDLLGNTATRPGPLISFFPFEPIVREAKYWLSEYGLRYSLQQTLTFVSMSDVMKGDSTLGYYTFDLQANWDIFSAPAAGTAGWVSTQVKAKSGIGAGGQSQDARSNLGTITDPTSIWSSVNGIRVPELAWAQSLRDGEVVVLAGMINQANYLDQNAYAGSGRKQFINSALVNSMVLPLRAYNLGVDLQWQPRNEWYALFGASVGNTSGGDAPWTDFNTDTYSLLWELGYAPTNCLGLGPGVYRIQPFLAQADGPAGGGLGFNLQQQLGMNSPFGYYGRFGFGGSDVSAGASAQVGTGFVMQAPLQYAGLSSRLSADLLGIGFV